MAVIIPFPGIKPPDDVYDNPGADLDWVNSFRGNVWRRFGSTIGVVFWMWQKAANDQPTYGGILIHPDSTDSCFCGRSFSLYTAIDKIMEQVPLFVADHTAMEGVETVETAAWLMVRHRHKQGSDLVWVERFLDENGSELGVTETVQVQHRCDAMWPRVRLLA